MYVQKRSISGEVESELTLRHLQSDFRRFIHIKGVHRIHPSYHTLTRTVIFHNLQSKK